MHVFFSGVAQIILTPSYRRALGGFGNFFGTFLLRLSLKYVSLKIYILKYRRMHIFHFFFGGSIFINVHISSSRAPKPDYGWKAVVWLNPCESTNFE